MKRHLLLLLLAIACKSKTPENRQLQTLASSQDVASADALGFLAEQPSDVTLLAAIDFGGPLEKQASNLFGPLSDSFRNMLPDLRELQSKRLGVDVLGVRSIGLSGWVPETQGMSNDDPIMIGWFKTTGAPAASVPRANVESADVYSLSNELSLTKVGDWWAISSDAGLRRFLASRANNKRLLDAEGEFVKAALATHRGGAWGALRAPKNLTSDDPLEKALAWMSASIGWHGVHVAMAPKAGQADALATLVNAQVAKARAGLAEAQTSMASDVPLLANIIGHYIKAADQSLTVASRGDILDVKFAMRVGAMQLPSLTPAAPVSRVATAGEFAVAQVSVGGPWIDQWLALTDVMGTPLDREGVRRDLLAALPVAVSPQASAVSLSVGAALKPLLTVAAAPDATDKTTDDWVARKDGDELVIGPAGAHEGSSRTALWDERFAKPGEGVLFRAVVDVKRAPVELQTMAQGFVNSAYVELGSKQFTVELRTADGKAQSLLALWQTGLGAAQVQVSDAYQKRNELPIADAVAAIYAHHSATYLAERFVPKAIGGDLLRLQVETDTVSSVQWRAMMGVAVVGIGAAVAIPAFMSYQSRARQTGDDMEAAARAAEEAAEAAEAGEGSEHGQPTPAAEIATD